MPERKGVYPQQAQAGKGFGANVTTSCFPLVAHICGLTDYTSSKFIASVFLFQSFSLPLLFWLLLFDFFFHGGKITRNTKFAIFILFKRIIQQQHLSTFTRLNNHWHPPSPEPSSSPKTGANR